MEPGEDDDQRHVEGLRRRDPAVYEIVFKKYYSPLVVFASRQVGDGEVARDLVQDVFLKLFEESQALPKNVCLKSWLYTSVRNAAIDYLRHKKKFGNLIVNEEQLPDIPAEAEVAQTGSQLSEEQLMAFVAQLPEGCRTVFNLYVFEEKSHKEIAALLHIKEHTSTSQLHRAKTLLAKRIKEYWAHERKK